jgi:hypothetical protein
MEKHYVVAVKNPSDWEQIHELLTLDGTLEDNIPSRACECTNLTEHSPTRSTYLLDEQEVELLLNNDKILSVELDPCEHYEEWRSTHPLPALRENRWGKNVKHYRSLSDNIPWATKAIAQNQGDWNTQEDRTGYQILRMTQKNDPWKTPIDYYTETNSQDTTDLVADASGDTRYHTPRNTISTDVQYEYDGTGIDIVITDDACWAGHPEFVTDSGVSQIYDIIFDAPYFIDPEYFDNNNLTTQFLGKTVPTEAAAKNWWSDASQRSAVFQVGGAKYFGTINANNLSWYTRAEFLGDFDNYPNEFDFYAPEYSNHGTNCASQAYGKNFGWAFNANKWFISYYIPDSIEFDFIKIFHFYKKDNPITNDKNPLVISASWGPYNNVPTDGFFKYRNEPIQGYNSNTIPGFLKHFNNVEYIKQTVNPNTTRTLDYATDSNSTIAKQVLDQLVSLDRLYFFYASGNSNNITVKPTDPDYNNYWVSSETTQPTVFNYVNRVGYPGNGGWNEDENEYACFSIGAIDDRVVLKDGTKKECKVVYSCMGTGIDIFAPAEKTLGASMYTSDPNFEYTTYERFDGIPGDGNSYNDLTIQAYDSSFGGTSSATPVTAGFFACFLQTRRNWNWIKLKKFIKNTIQPLSSNDFYTGQIATGPNDASWDDNFSLQGAPPKIPYLVEAPSITITQQLPTTQQVTLGNAVALTVFASETTITGTLSYQWEKAESTSPTTFTKINGATSNTYGFTPTLNDSGDVYRCRINGTFGVDETITNTTTLNVIQEAAGAQRFYVYQSFGLNNDGLDTFCVGVYAKRIRAGNGDNNSNYTYTNTGASSIVITLDDVEDLTTGMYAHLFPTINYSSRPDGSVNELFSRITITNITGNNVTLTHNQSGSVLIADLNYLPDVITRITFSPTDINKEVCFRPTDTSPPFSASPIGLTTNFDVAMVDDFTSNGGGNLNPGGKVTYSALEIKHNESDITSNVLIYSNQTITGYLPIQDDAGNTFYMILGS